MGIYIYIARIVLKSSSILEQADVQREGMPCNLDTSNILVMTA
jgi:hypothetical protein